MPRSATCVRPPLPSSPPLTQSSHEASLGESRDSNGPLPSSRLSAGPQRTVPLSDSPSFGNATVSSAAASSTRTGSAVNKIEQIIESVMDNVKRGKELNIFYQYRDLFRDQRVVDGLVDDIAYTLGLGRDSLNIVRKCNIQNTRSSKGYPTLVARCFLHQIHETAPRLPVYGLVDYDPHGIRIFRTYKHGSQSLSHEANTTVAGMKWLGIRSCDLVPAPAPHGRSSSQAWSALDAVLPMTETDRRTAVCLLKEMCLGVYDDPGVEEANLEQCHEVQVMLMLNAKAEIQAADDYGDLATWLDNKLCQAQEGDLEGI
ncbi:endodeoxyribonuclease [Sporothrix curviconia]|uniref:DNA topoisomerase (ATP-hydrolyzing) n=1 Tax=Sporothrix curviconia TaxID=1260050 RepID=A0ABP0CY26_9PEZI